MRLRTLSLAGVGSFADELEVDFEGLTTAGLFLIEGPTGSGKSTILDAIVFALYGSVAGSDSDPGRLNSHLRTESPFVELTFEVARTTYVVKRSPGHQRQKRRGTGMTEVPATAALMRIGPDGPEELATRASDVADHIQRIVGLTKQQFVSTVVLAQGEFATFLDAGTAERAQILERVFGTEFYKRVEDQLHVMRQQARRRRTCATESLNEAVHECGGVLDAQFSDEDPLTEIDAALDQLRSERAQAELTAQRAEERLKRAREALQAGEALVADQNRKREAMRRQADLTQTREQVLAFREQIGAHERATPVGPAIAAWRAAVEDARAAVDVHRRTLQVLLDLGEAPEVDPARLQEVDDLLARLLRPAELERGLSSRRADLERLGSQTRDAGAALLRAQRKREEVDDSVRATSERLQQQPDVAEQISELSAAEARLTARTVLWDELAARRDQWKTADARAQEALELVREAETAEHALSRDRAVELASALVAGKPCLVCGSVEHPDPAQPHESRPTGDIARLRQVVQQRRADADTARGESEKLMGVLQHLDSQCAGHDHEQDVRDLQACTAEIADLREQRAVREALQEELAGLVAQQLSVRDEVAVATLAHQQLASELAAAQESLTADEQIVTEACAEHESVAARRSALGAVRDALKAVADARIDARHCSVAESNAKAVLSETLASVGFSEVAAAEEAILDEAQYCSLKEAVELWDRQTAETAAALRELEAVDLEVCVDMEAQRAAAESARVLSREADGLVSRLADRLERGMPSREVVLRRLTELETVREQTEQVIRMADYATATRNEVTHKIRLSSFVLMRRFEDVVNAANDRLDTISEGRYQLVVETHGLDARSQAGLDVRVYDGRSDTHRSTKSLSGGERFYVSLALALGLADVVRSESGGVELGTLFIDEGFGSLDSEVLEEVMDMLEQVRVGEDRVIGLISHVEVLKQRIDPRISVRRDPERPGVSTAQVHL